MWGALSDERTDLSFTIASADIFGSDSHGTRDHNLLSQIRYLHFRRLLRLAGLWWRYSTLPPHGSRLNCLPYNPFARTEYKTPFPTVTIVAFLFVAAGICLPIRCLEMTVLYSPISQSFHIKAAIY
jgi:hypothetical protein